MSNALCSTIKNYFLMEQGNFYVQFLDIAEEELKKNSTDIDLKNLQSLFDVALKTVSNSSTATSFHLDTLSNKLIKADNDGNDMTEKDFVGESDEDFTDNLTCTLNTTNFISQLLQILAINVSLLTFPNPLHFKTYLMLALINQIYFVLATWGLEHSSRVRHKGSQAVVIDRPRGT